MPIALSDAATGQDFDRTLAAAYVVLEAIDLQIKLLEFGPSAAQTLLRENLPIKAGSLGTSPVLESEYGGLP